MLYHQLGNVNQKGQMKIETRLLVRLKEYFQLAVCYVLMPLTVNYEGTNT